MGAAPKDLFAVGYRNVPGKGVFASGGLKFQKEEDELRRQYAAALDRVSLNTLLGEATLWVLWPSTAAIWGFPILLWRLRLDLAVVAAIALFLAALVASMLFYARWLNYPVLVLGNRLVQTVVYTGWGLALWRTGSPAKVLALGAWLVLLSAGVLQVIFVTPFLPLLKAVFARGPADQALRNVARSYAPTPVR